MDEPKADEPATSLQGLLRSQLPRLARFLRRQCGPVLRAKESISDLRQSVCRELIERWKRSPSPDRAEGRRWIFQLARRKIVDRLRYYGAEKRDPAQERGSLPASDSISGARWAGDEKSPTPSEAAIDKERCDRIERDLARLPDDYREVIRLARQEGLSFAEIGKHLQRSEAAARKLFSRAMARLVSLAEEP
ncbi:MAG: sigma-70 family RNA polymerase sigma factor [Planctomycetota bacterium]